MRRWIVESLSDVCELAYLRKRFSLHTQRTVGSDCIVLIADFCFFPQKPFAPHQNFSAPENVYPTYPAQYPRQPLATQTNGVSLAPRPPDVADSQHPYNSNTNTEQSYLAPAKMNGLTSHRSDVHRKRERIRQPIGPLQTARRHQRRGRQHQKAPSKGRVGWHRRRGPEQRRLILDSQGQASTDRKQGARGGRISRGSGEPIAERHGGEVRTSAWPEKRAAARSACCGGRLLRRRAGWRNGETA